MRNLQLVAVPRDARQLLVGGGPASHRVGFFEQPSGLAFSAEALDACCDFRSKCPLLGKKRMRSDLPGRTRHCDAFRLDDFVELIQASLRCKKIFENQPLRLAKRTAFADQLALDPRPPILF
jgi:hypothetical protein